MTNRRANGDLHTALKTEEVERATGNGVEFLLMRLRHGKDDEEYTLHATPSSWSSWGVQRTDYLSYLEFRQFVCPFTKRDCMARGVSPDFDVDAFAAAFASGYDALSAANKHLDNCGFVLDQPEGWRMFGGGAPGRRRASAAGDGHNSPQSKTMETSEDGAFTLVLSWIEGGSDKGWTSHYRPKHAPISPEVDGALRFLGLATFPGCPEFDFEACYWKFFAYERRGDSPFSANTDYAYRSFRAHAEHFSAGIEQLLKAHSSVEPFGMSLLPTLPSPAARLATTIGQRVSRPANPPEPRPRDNREFDFEVAISFAGTERKHAEALAKRLTDAGIPVFYDEFFPEQLWGANLVVTFDAIYRKRARFCVMFVSKTYAERDWTNLERQSAQARALGEKGNEYILPVKCDDTELPGLLPTVGYLNIGMGIDTIADLLIKKLRG